MHTFPNRYLCNPKCKKLYLGFELKFLGVFSLIITTLPQMAPAYMYIYIYIYREREREAEREIYKDRERESDREKKDYNSFK